MTFHQYLTIYIVPTCFLLQFVSYTLVSKTIINQMMMIVRHFITLGVIIFMNFHVHTKGTFTNHHTGATLIGP